MHFRQLGPSSATVTQWNKFTLNSHGTQGLTTHQKRHRSDRTRYRVWSLPYLGRKVLIFICSVPIALTKHQP